MPWSPRDGVRATLATLALVSALAATMCGVPALDLADKKCASALDCSSGQVCTPQGSCVPAPDQTDSGSADAGGADSAAPDGASSPDFCQSIPRFTGTQLVDGDAADFTSVPPHYYPLASLVAQSMIVGDVLDTTARVGWSAAGLHLFFHVQYETGHVVVPDDAGPLWYGDALELFVKGRLPLTGEFDGVSDRGAEQIVAAPDPSNPPRTETYVGGGTATGPLPAGTIAAVRDSKGYDLEIFLPWSAVVATGEQAPAAGASIGFDFAVDYRARYDAGAANPQYQLLLALKTVVGDAAAADCQMRPPFPSCDDRTWCTPTLRP